MRHWTVPTLALWGIGAATAIGTPLSLTSADPDMSVVNNFISYNATAQQFSATGRPDALTTDTDEYVITNVTNTSYSLIAQIDNTGAAVGGTLAIGGKIPDLSATSGTLLTGTLFSFSNGTAINGDPFEFIFNVTGGDLAGLMGPRVGVIMSLKSTTFSSWEHNFTSGSLPTNDTFALPEPATLAFMALASGMFLHRRNAR